MSPLHFFLLPFIYLISTQAEDFFDDDICEAQIADTCFTDVSDDLRFIFDPVSNFLESFNKTALQDLCYAWIDSLNCTKNIIDDTCSGKGKTQFDVWNEGLFGVVDFLCSSDKHHLLAVSQSVKCWSILKFLQCVEEEGDLRSVADLLQTPQTKEECEKIQNVTFGCNVLATNPDCEDHIVIYSTLEAAFQVFFQDIHCTESEKSVRGFNGGNSVRNHVSVLSLISLVVGFVFQFQT